MFRKLPSGTLTIACIHVLFLAGYALHFSAQSRWSIAFLSFVALSLFAAYFLIPGNSVGKIRIQPVLLCTMGAILTFVFGYYLAMGPVISASIVGLGAALFDGFSRKSSTFSAEIYCGAFVGMSAPDVLDFPLIAGAGIIAGLLLSWSGNALSGYGGKLGSIAFGGVITMVFIRFFAGL